MPQRNVQAVSARYGQADSCDEDSDECEEDSDEFNINIIVSMVDTEKNDGYFVTMNVNNESCEMQIDTGAAYSVMCKALYDEKFSHVALSKCKVKLKA